MRLKAILVIGAMLAGGAALACNDTGKCDFGARKTQNLSI